MARATNLKGEYCQTCAETLDHHMKEPGEVLILDAECLKTLKNSGDYDIVRGHKAGETPEEKQSLGSKVKAKVKSLTGD